MAGYETIPPPFSAVNNEHYLPTASSLCLSFSASEEQQFLASKKRQERVKFSDEVGIIPCARIEDPGRTWLTANDYVETKAANRCIVRAMRIAVATGNDIYSLNSPTVCIRGIEDARSPSFLETKKKYKIASIKAVLDEQRKQRAMGLSDPCGLATVSRACSQWARESALASGRADAAYRADSWAQPTQLSQDLTIGLSKGGRKRKLDAPAGANPSPLARKKCLGEMTAPSSTDLMMLANIFPEKSEEPRHDSAAVDAISNNKTQLCYELLQLPLQQFRTNRYMQIS